MNLETIMLSKRTQIQGYILWFHLYKIFSIGKSIGTESKFVVARGLQGGRRRREQEVTV
jgi:hypothetical protein